MYFPYVILVIILRLFSVKASLQLDAQIKGLSDISGVDELANSAAQISLLSHWVIALTIAYLCVVCIGLVLGKILRKHKLIN
jgi:hypothetical protein